MRIRELLTEDDMNRLFVTGIESLIKSTKELISVWSVSEYRKEELRDDIRELEELLEIAKSQSV